MCGLLPHAARFTCRDKNGRSLVKSGNHHRHGRFCGRRGWFGGNWKPAWDSRIRRQFAAPPPTATSSGSTFLDLLGEWCPLFVHALRPARPLDLFGFTPPKLMPWENMGKIPSLNHPVFVRGEVSNAKTPFPPSWVNESMANGVRVWVNEQFDTRAEVFQ